MQQLRPGARAILREIDVTDKERWDKLAHDGIFCDSQELQDMCETLNDDIWWVLSVKTTGGTLSMVTSVEEGMGLEAYRKISSWYNNMNQTSVHEFRGQVMNPEPATKEAEVAERIETWVANVMHLKRIDKATATLPDGYFLSVLRRILCGRIKEHVDLMCSQRTEPSMQDVLGMVRTYAHIQRLALTLRSRTDMHVDDVR